MPKMDIDEFTDLISDRRRRIELLLTIENKRRERVPFVLKPIQSDYISSDHPRKIAVKPAQVGFSSVVIGDKLLDTLTVPGTNTVLIAYEEFITQRLLAKFDFFYKELEKKGIPGFPKIRHDSTYEKTFPQIHSSIYIASARSYVAGRAEVIHHLIADEKAFWPPQATIDIFTPALDRVPTEEGCTVDVLSTPNGEDNDFHDMYRLAKEGKSVFKSFFYPWWMEPGYSLAPLGLAMLIADTGLRNRMNTECTEVEFDLTQDEERLVSNYGLDYNQIRWRRYKILEKESLRRTGDTRRLFSQEFPEDDVSCFLATGNMYYNDVVVNEKAKDCYPATEFRGHAHIWYKPEAGKNYVVSLDPGQAKVTQSAITVIWYDADEKPHYCARAAGLWTPQVSAEIALDLAKWYNGALLTWERNSHGMAIAPFLSGYRNVYFEEDIVSGRRSMEMGWLTTSRKKDYMLQTLARFLQDMVVHDIEFVSECRNIRIAGDRIEIVGADDIHDSVCLNLVARGDRQRGARGYVGSSGFKW